MISFVLGKIEPTGGDRIIYDHVRILKSAGYNVNVYHTGFMSQCAEQKAHWEQLSCEMIEYKTFPFAIDSDLVVATGGNSARNVQTLNHPNKVWFLQNYDPYIFGHSESVSRVYDSYHKYLLYSHHLAKIVTKYHGNKKFVFCPTGIHASDEMEEFSQDGFRGDKRVFFAVVYYRSYKGITFANQVFGILKDQDFTTVEMNVMGGTLKNTTEYYQNVEMPKRYEIMASCDFCLHPSVFETWNLVSMESMMLGSVVVGTDSRGIREYATDDNSVLFSERNPKLVAAAIMDLHNNEDSYVRLQKSAKKTALSYDWNVIAPKILRAYENLL